MNLCIFTHHSMKQMTHGSIPDKHRLDPSKFQHNRYWVSIYGNSTLEIPWLKDQVRHYLLDSLLSKEKPSKNGPFQHEASCWKKTDWIISRFDLGKGLELKAAMRTLRSQLALNLLFQKAVFRFQTEMRNFFLSLYSKHGQCRCLGPMGKKNWGKSQGAKVRWHTPLAVTAISSYVVLVDFFFFLTTALQIDYFVVWAPKPSRHSYLNNHQMILFFLSRL